MRKLLLCLSLFLLFVSTVYAQDVTPEATPTVTVADLPPAVEELVGIWEGESFTADKTATTRLIFFPERAVFSMVALEKPETFFSGSYEQDKEDHLQGLAMFQAAPIPVGVGFDILEFEGDEITLKLTIASGTQSDEFHLTRITAPDDSADLVGTWGLESTGSTFTFHDDHTLTAGVGTTNLEGVYFFSDGTLETVGISPMDRKSTAILFGDRQIFIVAKFLSAEVEVDGDNLSLLVAGQEKPVVLTRLKDQK